MSPSLINPSLVPPAVSSGWAASTGSVAASTTNTAGNVWTTGAISCPVGDIIFLHLGFDNNNNGSGFPSLTSVSKPTGETSNWVTLGSLNTGASGGNGVRGELVALRVSGAATGTGTSSGAWAGFTPVVTVDLGGFGTNISAKCSEGFCMHNGSNPLTSHGSIPTTSTTSWTSSTVSISHTPPIIGDLVIGFYCVQMSPGALTPDSDTTNGSWSATIESGIAGNLTSGVQYKIVTATGTQTYDLAGNTTTSAAAVVSLSS